MTERPPHPDGPGADDVRALLAAYALDAVDDLERRAVERLVAADPAAAAELAELSAVAARLGAAHAAPGPPEVRARVLDAVARTPQAPRADDARPVARADQRREAAARARRRPLGLAVAAAAAAVVAVGVPSVVAWQQHERAVRAEARAETGEVVARLLADPTTTVVRDEVEGGGSAVGLLGAAQAALLVEDLPEPAAGTVYQLWAMRDGTPVPAGLLGGEQRLVAEDYRPGDGLALSVEPDGGSAQPTTDPVVVLLPG